MNHQRKKDSSTDEIIYMSRIPNSLKCQRNVTKETNPLQVDNLIINKSVTILETSRRILNKCVNISVLPNVKNF
jgi:hypothetical protein